MSKGVVPLTRRRAKSSLRSIGIGRQTRVRCAPEVVRFDGGGGSGGGGATAADDRLLNSLLGAVMTLLCAIPLRRSVKSAPIASPVLTATDASAAAPRMSGMPRRSRGLRRLSS